MRPGRHCAPVRRLQPRRGDGRARGVRDRHAGPREDGIALYIEHFRRKFALARGDPGAEPRGNHACQHGYWASGTAPATTTVTVAMERPLSIDGSLAFDRGRRLSATGAAVARPTSWPPTTCSSGRKPFRRCCPAHSRRSRARHGIATPVTCTVQIQWTEKAVAANAQQTNLNALQRRPIRCTCSHES